MQNELDESNGLTYLTNQPGCEVAVFAERTVITDL